MQICSAGHNPPLLMRDTEISCLEATGLPLGMFCESAFSVCKLQRNPGDMLLLFTDGLSEAMDPSRKNMVPSAYMHHEGLRCHGAGGVYIYLSERSPGFSIRHAER